MLIVPFLTAAKDLFLDAYSYQEKEIDTVSLVLTKIIHKFGVLELGRDRMERPGMRHVVASHDVRRFEDRMGVRFQREGEVTATIVTKGPGTGYRCREISARGLGSGCVNLAATDEAEAIVRCALLANVNHWFGGE